MAHSRPVSPPLSESGSEAGSGRSVPKGVTTFGEEIVSHQEQIRKEAEEQRIMFRDLRRYLQGHTGQGQESRAILVVHFNSYCRAGAYPDQLLASEFAIGAFSIMHGVLATAGGLIDPGVVPIGMRADAKESSEMQGLPMIGRHADMNIPTMTPADVLSTIDEWCTSLGVRIGDELCFFVERDCMPVVQRCLNWLIANQDKSDANAGKSYKLIPLTMVTVLMSEIAGETTKRSQDIMDEGMAERVIVHPQFAYSPELGCDYHSKAENANFVQYCSKNMVQRWMYNLLDYFCFVYHMNHVPGTHKPILKKIDVVDRVLQKYMVTKIPIRTSRPSLAVKAELARLIEQEYSTDPDDNYSETTQ